MQTVKRSGGQLLTGIPPAGWPTQPWRQYCLKRKVDEAITIFTSTAIKPDYAEASYDLGNALLQKEVDEALFLSQQALQITLTTRKPTTPWHALFQKEELTSDAHFNNAANQPDTRSPQNLGMRCAKGKCEEAIIHYQKPWNWSGRRDSGTLWIS